MHSLVVGWAFSFTAGADSRKNWVLRHLCVLENQLFKLCEKVEMWCTVKGRGPQGKGLVHRARHGN